MNPRYHREIMQEYAALRDRKELERKERTATVYERIPEIESIDRKMSQMGMDIARWVLRNPKDAEKGLREIQETLSALQSERAHLLKAQGLPETYLDSEFQCELCKDRGYLPEGHPCRCLRQRVIRRAYSDSNLENLLRTQNFSKFNLNRFPDTPFDGYDLSPRRNMTRIGESSKKFIENFESASTRNLLLYGNTGLGKTFLCSCIAKALLDKGYTVLYQTSFRIAEAMSAYKFGNREDQDAAEPYHQIYDCDLLIVDDLGTELTNAFTTSELFNILNSRLMDGKKMIFSTNLSHSELLRTYGDRVFSRLLSQFELLEFYGTDLRFNS